MNITVSMDSVLHFINSMSLSASNKEWLGRKLIEEAMSENSERKIESGNSIQTSDERIMKLSPRLQKLIGRVQISSEEIERDDRLAYILNK